VVVVDSDGNIVNDINIVLNKWQEEYQKMFTLEPQENDFEEEFYRELGDIDGHEFTTLPGLNHDITEDEDRQVIRKAKSNTSVGVDNLPNEILKNQCTIDVLVILFQKVFTMGLVPSVWNVGVSKLIPKSSMTDPRVSLQYRGISLLSTVYKLFSGILNKRIVDVPDLNNLYADEQNGFRKGRACIDHIYALTSIIRSRKAKRKPTFACFVGFAEACDCVDKKL
jgi:hypothetical protein